MTVFYGSDSACVTDIGLIDTQVTSPAQVIGQRIARLLQPPRGAFGLINDDANRGWDVRQYVNAQLTPSTIAIAQQQIKNECEKDEEVQSATVTMTNSGGTITITISIVASSGPFTLVGNINQFSVA